MDDKRTRPRQAAAVGRDVAAKRVTLDEQPNSVHMNWQKHTETHWSPPVYVDAMPVAFAGLTTPDT